MNELKKIRENKKKEIMEEQTKKSQNKVIVYSTSTCPYCDRAKKYLKKKGVEYEDHNVAQDREKAKEMIKKSNQRGVPVLDVNGKIIIGFNKPEIEKALN